MRFCKLETNQLLNLLNEINACVEDYKKVKGENNNLKGIIASLQETIVEKDNIIISKNSEIEELTTKVSELEEAANLNLAKAQEIVNKLKEIANA